MAAEEDDEVAQFAEHMTGPIALEELVQKAFAKSRVTPKKKKKRASGRHKTKREALLEQELRISEMKLAKATQASTPSERAQRAAKRHETDAENLSLQTPQTGRGSRTCRQLQLGAHQDVKSRQESGNQKLLRVKRELESAKGEKAEIQSKNEEMQRELQVKTKETEAMSKQLQKADAKLAHRAETIAKESALKKTAMAEVKSAVKAKAKAEAEAEAEREKRMAAEALAAENAKEAEKQAKLAKHAKDVVASIKKMIGVPVDKNIPLSKPVRIAERTGSGAIVHKSKEVKHLSTVLNQRSVEVVASAIKEAGGIELLKGLIHSDVFHVEVYQIIKDAADAMQEVWCPRHSVHVMSNLSLSRELFELLRHLLSYKYVPPTDGFNGDGETSSSGDRYVRRTMYTSPFNKRLKVDFPELQPRKKREDEKQAILGDCVLEQGDDGASAGRADLIEAIGNMISTYWGPAIREDVLKGDEKLLLIGFGDGTGGWRGCGVSHFETGIGSWRNGRSQSKIALLPCHLTEGSDHFPNLHARCGKLFGGWQKLISNGTISFFPPTDSAIQMRKEIPIDFRMAGDFQILKSINNMSLYTHPIWCECCGNELNTWPKEPFANWAEVSTYLEKTCKIKTLERICQLNGMSYEKLLGRPFKPFNCGQKACKHLHTWKTEAEWQSFNKGILDLEEAEYKHVAREWGGFHARHYPGYNPLLYSDKLGMMLFSCDILHLIFINLYKMHFENTILTFLMELSAEARQPIEAFLHSHSIPIKLATATASVEALNSLTGRDAKVMCQKGAEILPELLMWAHAPQEAVEQAAKELAKEMAAGQKKTAAPEAHDNVFTMERPDGASSDDDDDADDAAAEERVEVLESRKSIYAGYWEDFHKVVHAVRLFERDDLEYRKERATELYNAGCIVGNNMVQLRTQFDSAVPHVLTNVVTRQMVLDGDPNRRATDQSEAFGVPLKFDLHNRCNRQRINPNGRMHTRKDSQGNIIKQWTQKLKTGRVMQVFKASVLRERLRADPASKPFLTRKDYQINSTGFVTNKEAGVESRLSKILGTSIKDALAKKADA